MRLSRRVSPDGNAPVSAWVISNSALAFIRKCLIPLGGLYLLLGILGGRSAGSLAEAGTSGIERALLSASRSRGTDGRAARNWRIGTRLARQAGGGLRATGERLHFATVSRRLNLHR